MSTYKLITILAKYQITNLTTSIYLFNLLKSRNIEKPNTTICGSCSTNQQIILMRGPTYCFNCCLMLIKLMDR